MKIRYHSSFKKDYKLMKKRSYDMSKLNNIISDLSYNKKLDKKYRDHELKGNYKGFRECHIEPDWLLIYKIENDVLTLVLLRTGTHADLF